MNINIKEANPNDTPSAHESKLHLAQKNKQIQMILQVAQL